MTRESDPRTAVPFVERVKCTSDETPPWDGIIFTQPVDSDKLAEDLKRAYPDGSTLRERKHMATIDFLKIELQQMRSRTVATSIDKRSEYLITPEASSFYADTIDAHSRQGSMSSSHTRASATQHPTTEVRKLERDESSISFAPIFVPSNITPAPQIVFSASDGRPLQVHTKRRMTKEEKVMYKKIRKRGACIACRRQKGKCTHIDDNFAEPESPEGTTKMRKRALSLELDMEDGHLNKDRKTSRQPTENETYPTPPIPPGQQVTTNSLGTINVTDGFEQPTGVSESTPWVHEMEEDGQDGQYRYVQHRLPVDPYTSSITYEPDATWREYPIVANIQQPYPEYVQLQATDLSRECAPLSPVANTSPMDVSYQSTFSGYLREPWDGTQDEQPNGMEPE